MFKVKYLTIEIYIVVHGILGFRYFYLTRLKGCICDCHLQYGKCSKVCCRTSQRWQHTATVDSNVILFFASRNLSKFKLQTICLFFVHSGLPKRKSSATSTVTVTSQLPSPITMLEMAYGRSYCNLSSRVHDEDFAIQGHFTGRLSEVMRMLKILEPLERALQ